MVGVASADAAPGATPMLYQRGTCDTTNMQPAEAEKIIFERQYVPSLSVVIKAYPETMGPLLAYAHSVMDMDGSFVMGEKYLMGSYVSTLLNCPFCQESLESAALMCNVDDGLVGLLAENVNSAPIHPRLRPIFHYARKLTLEPDQITHADTEACLAVGWPKRAVFEANTIVGLFSLMSRTVLGLHVASSQERTKMSGQMLAKKGYNGVLTMHGIHSPYASCDSSEVSRLRSESSGPASVRTASDVDSAGCSGGGLQLRPGMRVTLQKCKNPQHDGKQAMVLEYVVHAGNWRVELDTAVVIRVVEENCLVEEEVLEEHPPLGEGRPFDLCDAPDMSVPSQDPYTLRRNDLAASRFFRVQERMAKEFSSPGIFESSHVEVCDDTESIFFKLNTKWDKGRKALFAKCYTKLYKQGNRKLSVIILDKSKRGDASP
eukprot:Rhum_TRINITY_DN14764_c3_g1::Rhum_TRINITY_DN14764_c3_g1_i1::g.116066::m.116066